MKNKKTISLIEIIVTLGLLGYIINRWNVVKVSLGDFFILEVLALMVYYSYENFRQNNQNNQKDGKNSNKE